MNPITQKILDDLGDDSLREYVTAWGALEQLVIGVYRAGAATRQDNREHRQLRRQLERLHPDYAEELAAYWPSATVAGHPAEEDPFAVLLSIRRAAAFVDNWRIMQTLPAVRQALNEWLVDKLAAQQNNDA